MKALKPKNHRILTLVIAVVLVIAAGVGIWWYVNINNQSKSVEDTNKSAESKKETEPAETKPIIPVIHMAAMGDMLAHDTIIANAKVGDSYDFGKFFANILPIYKNVKVVFFNPEGLS